MEDQMQALGGKIEELAAPSYGLDLQTMQRREWWIVGLERAEGDEIDASDAVPDALVGQEPRQRLHFRHLRHGPIMNIRLSGRARQAGAAAARRRAAGG